MTSERDLLQRLASLDPVVSTAAAEALAGDGNADAFPVLWTSVLRDCGMEHIPEGKVRAAARVAGPRAIARLVEQLESFDEEVRVLEEDEEDPDAGDRSDELHRAHRAAVLVLAAVGEPAVDPLIALLLRGGPLARGLGAAEALRHIASPRASEALRGALAGETDPAAAGFMIRAIEAGAGEGGAAEAVEAIRPWLQPDPDLNVWIPVRASAEALVRLQGEAVLPDLLEAAKSPAAEVRIGVVAGLALLSVAEARAALERLAADSHPRVARTAGRALASNRTPDTRSEPERDA